MGVTGVEGVFRRCCEETLCVMRTNKEALLTIIEVETPGIDGIAILIIWKLPIIL